MPLFTRHPLALQTAFSEITRRAAEQPFLLAGTPGSVGVREVHGRRFLYRQFYDAEGKKCADYLGPVGDARAEERAQAVRDQIALAGALVKEARLLTRSGYVRTDARAVAVLAAMANRGLFRAGATLVGSHAYGALLNVLGVRAAAFATEDVDLARDRPLDLDLTPDLDFSTILAESTVTLLPVPSLDRKAPPTSYKAPGADRFRVDLLVPGRAEEITVQRVPELRASAQALPFLRPLLVEPGDAVVLGREGVVPVRVPRPEVFAWHKTLVSDLRGATSDKRGKDVHQAAVLFAYLAEDAPDAIAEAFDALPRAARPRARSGAKRVVALLEGSGHERAAELLVAPR